MLGLVMVLSATSVSEVGRSRLAVADLPAVRRCGRGSAWLGCGDDACPAVGGGASHRPDPGGLASGYDAPAVRARRRRHDQRGAVVGGVRSFGFQPSEFLKLAADRSAPTTSPGHQDEMHCRGAPCSLVLVVGGLPPAWLRPGRPRLGDRARRRDRLHVGFIAGVPLSCTSARPPPSAPSARSFAIVSDPYRFSRFTAFRDIDGNKEYLAWQTFQGLLGMANGGLDRRQGSAAAGPRWGTCRSRTATSSSP